VDPRAFGVIDHLGDGRRAFAEGRHADALFSFSQRISEAPDDAWGWHGRGDALQLLGAHADALEAYERAAALRPDTALHHAGRANALRSLGDPRAAAAWTEVISRDPGLAWMRDG